MRTGRSGVGPDCGTERETAEAFLSLLAADFKLEAVLLIELPESPVLARAAVLIRGALSSVSQLHCILSVSCSVPSEAVQRATNSEEFAQA